MKIGRLLPNTPDVGWLPYAWLIYLPIFFVEPAFTGSLRLWAFSVGGVLVFLVAYFRGFWLRGHQLLVVIVALSALGVIYAPFNTGSSIFFVYAGSFAGRMDRTRDVWITTAVVTAVAALTSLVIDVPLYFWISAIVFTPLIAGANAHMTNVQGMNTQLRLAQHENRHLAAVAERERIARDLHDALGHTLSLIVLKSELASKLASRDVERALVEIKEVEVITRKALAEMREAVRGYRTTLADEVMQARELLDAARIRAEVDVPEGLQLPRAVDDILGVSLRELVTNVVRHSRASTCTIRIVTGEQVRLEVADDGQGGSGVGGSGLDGLRQRLDAVGGSLRLDGATGFRAVVSMPNAPAPVHESSDDPDVRVAV